MFPIQGADRGHIQEPPPRAAFAPRSRGPGRSALRAGIELLIGLHASRGPASPLGPLPAGPRGLAGLGRGGVPRATSRARQLLTGGLLLVLALLTACVNGQDRPIAVSLDELARKEASYDGKLVRTQGVVRSFERPRHYWIEDAGLQRVGLVPGDVVAPLVDREVHVVGRFRFDERTGRVIEVERIEPLSVRLKADPPRRARLRFRPPVDGAGIRRRGFVNEGADSSPKSADEDAAEGPVPGRAPPGRSGSRL